MSANAQQQSPNSQSTSDEMHVFIGYNHDSRRTMLAPFPTESTDRPLDELSDEFRAHTGLGLFMKPAHVDGLYDDLTGVIESMERHSPEWDHAIAYLEQFVE